MFLFKVLNGQKANKQTDARGTSSAETAHIGSFAIVSSPRQTACKEPQI
jgi:hypothetical protein